MSQDTTFGSQQPSPADAAPRRDDDSGTHAGHGAAAELEATKAGPGGGAPVVRARRIDSVDVARGVALLGILLMNIVSFALPHQAYDNPTVGGGGATGANLWVWFVNSVLFEGKMRAIFSMLFGAGVVLLTSREAKAGRGTTADIYYRRLIWLLVFGVLDAYVLLWPGDILFNYAVCGLFLYPLRHVAPKKLIVAGAICLAVIFPKVLLWQFETQGLRAEAAAAQEAAAGGAQLTREQQEAVRGWEERQRETQPTPEQLAETVGAVRSGYPTVFLKFVPVNSYLQSSKLYQYFFWDALGMMLIGMGLIKLGFFSAARSFRFYALTALVGYGVGLPLGLHAALARVRAGFDLDSFFTAYYTYDLRRVSVSLAHVAVVMLVCKSGALSRLTSRLAAVGQTALTNYVTHTVVCTLLFYGYGLGLYGQLQRWQLYLVVAAIWAFQLAACPVWLRYFQFGPLEWVWRSLTYWRRQPMRLRPAASGGTSAEPAAATPAPLASDAAGLLAGTPPHTPDAPAPADSRDAARVEV